MTTSYLLTVIIPGALFLITAIAIAVVVLWPSEKRVRRARERQEAERRAKQRRLFEVGKVVWV